MRERLVALLLVSALASIARAGDSPESAPAKPETPSQPAPASPSESDDEAPKPYLEGWRGGSPPGEHAALRADLWFLALQHTALELGHLERIRAVTTGDLGLPRAGTAGGLGAEVYTGKTGWVSIDWWTLQSRGEAPLGRDFSIDETSFAAGALAVSEVTQHIVKIRDGLDIRYRIPLGEGTNLDFNFGPVSALLVRYESVTVGVPQGPKASDALLTVTLCPGWRAGVDLYLPHGIEVRIGNDVDLLPHLGHNWLSFTRAPSVDAWADARVFFAARVSFIEVAAGWRYMRTLASGGHFRQAESDMRDVFAELSARF